MRAQDRAARQRMVDIPSAPITSRAATASATATRSAPASRRNSSSSSGEDADVHFEREIERAIIASVESVMGDASTSTSRSGPGSPFDEALRKAIADSLAEAEAGARNAEDVEVVSSPEAGARNAEDVEVVSSPEVVDAATRGRVARRVVELNSRIRRSILEDLGGAAGGGGASSGVNSRVATGNASGQTTTTTTNDEVEDESPVDVFIRRMGSILEDFDSGGASLGVTNASAAFHINEALQMAGISQPTRRNLTRMLDAVTRQMERGTERAAAQENLDSEEENDDAIFVSLAEVKTTMRGFGISGGTISSLCHTLRRFALS